jgi:type IV secretion system protein VirB3
MQAEIIYKGATRPAMLMGIPLTPLVATFGVGMLSGIWSGALVSWWIALGILLVLVPALLWMRLVTAQDDQRLRQIFFAARLRLHDRNRYLWQSRSYSPTVYRGARDAWHA